MTNDELQDATTKLVSVLFDKYGLSSEEVLKNTPRRIASAWKEILRGYEMNSGDILSKTFESDTNEMVVSGPIDFVSVCEHHFLPFIGKAYVGYIPHDGKIVGISKLARVVECFSCRFQVQEKLTREIAGSIKSALSPKAVGVVLKATHLCQSIRGVKQSNTMLTTSCMLDGFKENDSARAEFLRLIDWK